MTSSNWILAVVGAAGLTLTVSCEKDNEAMTPASGVAPRFTARETADTIAHERCQRAQECGKIGNVESDFSTFEQCKLRFRNDLDEKFAGERCANGVGDRDLRECLGEISNEDCEGVSGVVDSVDRYLACRANKLCLD
jgi:hypothetical protein